MLGDGFGHAVKYTFQIPGLTGVLNLNDHDFILAVARLDIHTVKLVVSMDLVAFTLQYFNDGDFLI